MNRYLLRFSCLHYEDSLTLKQVLIGYRCRVRYLFAAITIASSCVCSADYVITVPNARKILNQEFKAEYTWEASTRANVKTWLAYGLNQAIEVALTSETVSPRDRICSFDLSYSIAYPFVNKIPGLSVGVIDGCNSSRDGRHFYLATSYDVGMTGQYNGNTPMTVVIGGFFGSMNGPFVGVTIPYTETFRLLAEHDTKHITAGFEFKPAKEASIRWMFRDQTVMWSVGFSGSF